MPIISFQDVRKTYDHVPVLDQFNLTIEQGEFVVLLGPSGCGKTTILKLINGLLKPDKGVISVHSKALSEWDLIQLRRRIGYVIQQVGLLPHLTIEKNICYTLNLIKASKDDMNKRAKELIDFVGMDESYLKRYPRALSGGQQQRIGVARALASDPDIILMDEPFGAVDEVTRRSLQDEMLKIHQKLGKTIIFVTHDIEEAIKLGTRIVLLNEGRIDRDYNKKSFVLTKERSDYAEHFFGSKDFIAYLNTISISACLNKVMDISSNHKDDYPSINGNLSILQGIQRCIETQHNTLCVVDDQAHQLGYFSINSIYHLL
ncbi:MAG: glycine/betaine ABC transporter ATP-binding protein [Firmicutes bacterium HGW-Firmicutes-7]|nr:MAG: glycine/betaine ABC transporter ATP-binding protein [Firmicutes bacterium HGW-Firmicutes-7]